MKIKSVSQTIFKQTDSKLVIKLSSVVLDGMDEISYYNLYETDRYDYLSVNVNSYITIQYKAESLAYDRNQTVRITDNDLYQFNKKLMDFYKKLTRSDMFTYYKSGTITCNSRRDDVITISLKSGGFLELEPGVIVDKNTNSALPGVYLYINMKDQKAEISIDEFEYLLYKFSRIDINSEGLKLIMMKLLLEDKLTPTKSRVLDNDTQITSDPIRRSQNKPVSIFDAEQKIERVVTPTPLKTINSIDQLM